VKPAPFEYVAARSVDEAVGLLGEDARVLAGGQSLVPLLNFRLARPARLVDVNGIDGLGVIRRVDGTLTIGATVRQAALERSRLVADHWPLLRQAVRHVGHAATRSRGTVGGSVAHADPNAELPAAFVALDARFVTNARAIAAADFFTGPLMTVLEPDELLTAIHLPPLPDHATTAFAEFARTHGDFAEAGVAIVLAPGHARVALLGGTRATAAEDALNNGAGAAEVAARAAETVEHDHRRALVAHLTRQALSQAGRR
jgi:CO/xanthine dehydrogenase FAD-binding subunit